MSAKNAIRLAVATLLVAAIVAGLALLPVKDYLAQLLVPFPLGKFRVS